MRLTVAALLATTILVPAAFAAPVDLFATFDVAGQTFSPEEDVPDTFSNDQSGGFMSPQTGTGNDDSIFAREAAERELREDTFNPNLPFGGAQWVGENNSEVSVPRYTGSTYAGAPVSDFENKWVLPESAWDFDQVSARFVLDSDDFTLAAISSGIDGEDRTNTDLAAGSFSLLDDPVDPLFLTNDQSGVFATISGGEITGSFNFGTTFAVALNSSGEANEAGDTQGADILIIGALDQLNGPADDAVGLYAMAVFGDTNWFESALLENEENNLLDTLTRVDENGDSFYGLQSQLFVEERRWGVDENGFVPLGTYEIQGSLNTLRTETSGSSEASALLVDEVVENENGDVQFDFGVQIDEFVADGGILWIDPDVATGYTYEATTTLADGSVVNVGITDVQAPTLEFVNDTTGYTLRITDIIDNDGNLVALTGTLPEFPIVAGEIVNFAAEGFVGRVGRFELVDIDTGLALDPENPQVFQTGLAFDVTSGFLNISQTPQTTFIPDPVDPVSAVPLPLPAAMLLSGLGLFAFVGRRRRSQA